MKQSSGQVTIEFILLTAVILGGSLFAKDFITNKYNLLDKSIVQPWAYIQTMAETGVWMQSSKKVFSEGKHPNEHGTTREGDNAP